MSLFHHTCKLLTRASAASQRLARQPAVFVGAKPFFFILATWFFPFFFLLSLGPQLLVAPIQNALRANLESLLPFAHPPRRTKRPQSIPTTANGLGARADGARCSMERGVLRSRPTRPCRIGAKTCIMWATSRRRRAKHSLTVEREDCQTGYTVAPPGACRRRTVEVMPLAHLHLQQLTSAM